MKYPVDAIIATTYRCQARCRMCSIWQITEHNDVAPGVYNKIPTTLKDVNISGGEPFLRKDLEEIVGVVHERVPKARMVVSSNAFMGDAIIPRAVSLTKIFPDIGFGISFDGVGEMHDYVRGIPGGYEKIVGVVKSLKRENIRNIRIAFTLTKENSEHMIKVYELARELGVQFTMQVSHNSDLYFGNHESSVIDGRNPHFGTEKLRKDFETIINGELASYELKRLVKAFVYYGMYKLAANGEQLFTSRPGVDYFYLDPSGDVYPSVLHNHIMGNIVNDDFDTLWHSDVANQARQKCAEDNAPYWLGCTLRQALLDHKFQIGAWALKNKLFRLRLQ